MNYLQIPVQAIASQIIAVSINSQNCSITLRELNGRQYFSLSLNGASICDNVLMQSHSSIINAAYMGFIGEFLVLDLSGADAPNYTGWGSRWILVYYYG